MKTLTTLTLALFIVSNSHADLPTSAEWLGATVAFFDRCEELDPAQAAKYRGHLDALVERSMEPAERAELRRTAEYESSYRTVLDDLGKAPKALVASEGCPTLFELHR